MIMIIFVLTLRFVAEWIGYHTNPTGWTARTEGQTRSEKVGFRFLTSFNIDFSKKYIIFADSNQ